jgi:hypothetical protein
MRGERRSFTEALPPTLAVGSRTSTPTSTSWHPPGLPWAPGIVPTSGPRAARQVTASRLAVGTATRLPSAPQDRRALLRPPECPAEDPEAQEEEGRKGEPAERSQNRPPGLEAGEYEGAHIPAGGALSQKRPGPERRSRPEPGAELEAGGDTNRHEGGGHPPPGQSRPGGWKGFEEAVREAAQGSDHHQARERRSEQLAQESEDQHTPPPDVRGDRPRPGALAPSLPVKTRGGKQKAA